MSDLIRKTKERMAATNNEDALALKIWEHILKFIETGDLNYTWEGYNCEKYPSIEKRVISQLNGWCKLVGLKPHFEFRGSSQMWSETNSGRSYSYTKCWWTLVLTKQTLPSNKTKARIIKEHGKPPGY